MENPQEKSLTTDQVIGNFLDSKLALYKARDNYEAVLKNYHDHADILIQVIRAYEKSLSQLDKENKELKNNDGKKLKK